MVARRSLGQSRLVSFSFLAQKQRLIPIEAALNFPYHRGTATAFPLSAFGLSAFFFSSISTFAFPDNTSSFLLLLAIGTFCMIFVSSFFLRVIPHSTAYYPTAPGERGRITSCNPLQHRKSRDGKRNPGSLSPEPGTQPVASDQSSPYPDDDAKDATPIQVHDTQNEDTNESSSLISKSSTSSPENVDNDAGKGGNVAHDSPHLDIRGLALLPRIEFWQLFVLLGLLTGIGLMTIKYVECISIFKIWLTFMIAT